MAIGRPYGEQGYDHGDQADRDVDLHEQGCRNSRSHEASSAYMHPLQRLEASQIRRIHSWTPLLALDDSCARLAATTFR